MSPQVCLDGNYPSRLNTQTTDCKPNVRILRGGRGVEADGVRAYKVSRGPCASLRQNRRNYSHGAVLFWGGVPQLMLTHDASKKALDLFKRVVRSSISFLTSPSRLLLENNSKLRLLTATLSLHK